MEIETIFQKLSDSLVLSREWKAAAQTELGVFAKTHSQVAVLPKNLITFQKPLASLIGPAKIVGLALIGASVIVSARFNKAAPSTSSVSSPSIVSVSPEVEGITTSPKPTVSPSPSSSPSSSPTSSPSSSDKKNPGWHLGQEEEDPSEVKPGKNK